MNILLLEDEQDSAEMLSRFLGMNGFSVTTVADGSAALEALRHEPLPDLAILDVMVPGLDGREVLRQLRQHPATAQLPVIFLTARDQEKDEIEGLALGADDYMTKPVSLNRLLARIQNLLRRRPQTEAPALLEVDSAGRICRVMGQPVELTSTEFQLLELFWANPSRIFSRQDILEMIAEPGKPVFDRTVDAHIKNLRGKLGPAADCIRTVRGIGYGWAI